ncbi:MAG: heme-copper oxidase subunit III [Bacteroidia bacterium]
MTSDPAVSDEQLNKEKANRMLMWLGIAAMVIFFGGLTSAYIVRMNGGNWRDIRLPYQFYISTALILLSSLTMNMSVSAVKKGRNATPTLTLTLSLGLGFALFQFLGWRELTHAGIYFTGKSSIASGQYLYVLTWAHLMHLIGGLISLIWVSAKSSRGLYSSTNYNGLRISGIFWHFLDILWVYLFLFLLFIRYLA